LTDFFVDLLDLDIKVCDHRLNRARSLGYARVGTRDQTVALQVDALKAAGCAKVYTEVVGGAAAERPILARLLDDVRSGDVVMIWKLDRLGRSLKHLIEIVNRKMLTEMIAARPKDIRSFLRGRLPPGTNAGAA
jgi:hypothetical protein